MTDGVFSMPLLVLGAGGHARVVIEALRRLNAQIIGVADPGLPARAEGPFGIAVLGDDSAVSAQKTDEILLVNGIGSLPASRARRDAFEKFSAQGYEFATVIHPNAFIADGVAVGEGVQVMAGAVIQPGAVIGVNVIINTRASIDHDCQIGQGVHVAPGATLSGGVQVGDHAHVGAGAVVIQSVTLGEKSVVGAGAVVVRDVEAGETVASPAARPLNQTSSRS